MQNCRPQSRLKMLILGVVYLFIIQCVYLILHDSHLYRQFEVVAPKNDGTGQEQARATHSGSHVLPLLHQFLFT